MLEANGVLSSRTNLIELNSPAVHEAMQKLGAAGDVEVEQRRNLSDVMKARSYMAWGTAKESYAVVAAWSVLQPKYGNCVLHETGFTVADTSQCVSLILMALMCALRNVHMVAVAQAA